MNFKKSDFSIKALGSIGLCTIMLSGCGGGTSSDTTSSVSSSTEVHAVNMHANVTGLATGTSLALVNSAGAALNLSHEGSYAFPPIANTSGIEPTVTLQSSTDDQVCSPANGSGMEFGTNNYNANIACSDRRRSYTIGGHLHGLRRDHHHELIIENNDGKPLRLNHNGEFQFSDRVARNGSYRVHVERQPTKMVCSIAHGSGSGVVRNVSNIEIECSDEGFKIGGRVSGLIAGQVVSISDGSNKTPLILRTNGEYTFPFPVSEHGSFNVTITSQPTDGICTVLNGRGDRLHADVSDINIICTPDRYPVSGTVTGLAAGEQVTLQNNGADDMTVTANQQFTFKTPVAAGAGYQVTIGTQPFPETCTVSNGSGSDVTAPIVNVQVNCAAGVYTVLTSLGGSSIPVGTTVGGNLVQAGDGNFYGISVTGGANGYGAIYRVSATGNITVIYSSASGYEPYFAGLILGTDGYLYGTTAYGGPGNCGSVFKVSISGSYKMLHQFTGSTSDGCNPQGGLLLASNGSLYGMTTNAGTFSKGTVFKVATDGSTENLVYSFGAVSSDGFNPMYSSLIEIGDGSLYGVTASGGSYGNGTVFKLNAAGIETILHNFGDYLPGDGFLPWSSLSVGPDGKLYGTTFNGGLFFGFFGQGTVFSLNTDGSNYAVIHEFASGPNDGAQPLGANLVLASDGNFYSTTTTGGTANGGVLYRITTSGTVTVLYEFQGGASDGIFPESGITIGTDGYLYGVTSQGGTNSVGVVYRY